MVWTHTKARRSTRQLSGSCAILSFTKGCRTRRPFARRKPVQHAKKMTTSENALLLASVGAKVWTSAVSNVTGKADGSDGHTFLQC